MLKKKVNNQIFALTVTSVMVAMSVVLCRFVGFSPEGTPFRFEFGFLPIAFVGYMLGPLYAGLGYLVADVIGSLFSGYAPNVWISLCQFATGAVFGLFFHKKKISLPSILLCFGSVAVVIDFLLKSPIFVFMYDWTWEFTLATRAINGAVNFLLRAVTFYLFIRLLKEQMDRISKKFIKTVNKMNTSDFKSYANSFQAVTVPGLERISRMLDHLGHPEDKLKFIHIAGTNGKGSTSANIACILEEAGYTVGKYISPNLIRVNERISINGADISDKDLSRILGLIEPISKSVEDELTVPPTQFEIWTAAAFVYFAEQKCDYVVLEVGLGGEFDATNVIKANEVAIITRLGIDHTGYLGSTIAEIAKAKAGIIKENSRTGAVITVEQEPEAMEVLRAAAEENGCSLEVAKPVSLYVSGTHECFSLGGLDRLMTGISGYHQIENAALAVLAAKALGIEEGFIRRGISRAKNPARFEVIRKNPTVIYDGGHNENGIASLTASLERYFGKADKTVIFACMKDKEIDESLKMLSENNTKFIYTTVKDNPRAMGASELATKAKKLGFEGMWFDEISDAYKYALMQGNLVVVCGSLYLYKDFEECKKLKI
ncbi:MAG: folate family ECF transporter S component [Clostridia bacterium]|nr:folate family ECF transporter S component [Clostridia bacterium]